MVKNPGFKFTKWYQSALWHVLDSWGIKAGGRFTKLAVTVIKLMVAHTHTHIYTDALKQQVTLHCTWADTHTQRLAGCTCSCSAVNDVRALLAGFGWQSWSEGSAPSRVSPVPLREHNHTRSHSHFSYFYSKITQNSGVTSLQANFVVAQVCVIKWTICPNNPFHIIQMFSCQQPQSPKYLYCYGHSHWQHRRELRPSAGVVITRVKNTGINKVHLNFRIHMERVGLQLLFWLKHNTSHFFISFVSLSLWLIVF